MEPKDIGRLVNVGSPAVSPDGAQVAFVVSRVDLEKNAYRSAIWLADVDGSAPPRQLTSGDHEDGNPTWSPDGTTLAFTSNRKVEDAGGKGKGEKLSTLHLLPVRHAGEVVSLCELPEGIDAPAWSPSGDRLAFAARKRSDRYDSGDDDAARLPRRIDRLFTRLDSVGWIVDRPSQIWVVPVDGSFPATPVTSGPHESAAPAWSPDGRRLAFTSTRAQGWDRWGAIDLCTIDVGVDAEIADPQVLTDGTGA